MLAVVDVASFGKAKARLAITLEFVALLLMILLIAMGRHLVALTLIRAVIVSVDSR